MLGCIGSLKPTFYIKKKKKKKKRKKEKENGDNSEKE
jgi:hypothetical protein